MSDPQTLQGRCLCGAVQVSARFTVPAGEASPSVGACHCRMCRRWGGGPLLALECSEGLRFEGEAEIGVYASSDWAERGFCRRCGTHLFYRLKGGGLHALPAGLFGDVPLRFDHQVFVDEQPAWYGFANDTEKLTGPELFARHGAG